MQIFKNYVGFNRTEMNLIAILNLMRSITELTSLIAESFQIGI
jgi:hypothetical protein